MKTYLRQSLSSLLGTVVHRVIRRAQLGDFEWAVGDGSCLGEHSARTVAERLWEDEIRNCRTYCMLSSSDPRGWPNYGLWMARTLHLVTRELIGKRLAQAVASPNGRSFHSESQEDLQGFPDRVIRSRDGLIVEDYKSGNIYDNLGTVHPQYRQQLLFYAFLVHLRYGEWPSLVRLQPLEGTPYEEKPSSSEAVEYIKHAQMLLAQYQQTLRSIGDDPVAQMYGLASPSVTSCRRCPVRPWCEPYWESPTCAMDSDRKDVQGTVTTDWDKGLLKLDTSDGITVTVTGLPGGMAEPIVQGDCMRLLNLRAVRTPVHLKFDGYSECWKRGESGYGNRR